MPPKKFKNPFPGFPFDGGAMARDAAEIRANWAAFEAAQPASPGAAPELSPEQAAAKIKERQREMERQPCYRCGHRNSWPDLSCVCCANAHTPNADGRFDADSG